MSITSEQRAEFTKMLLEEKERIEEQLNAIARKVGDNDYEVIPDAEMKADGFRADLQENADEVEEFGNRLGLLNALEPRLVDILNALDKLTNAPDTFGLDENTGDPINIERLKVNPAARANI